ncbi:MAG: MFS transporter [Bacteriovoracaceae bacterium]
MLNQIKTLGKSFWLFRIGQFISGAGDSINTIAIAWWILEKTGSATVMSSIIAPLSFFNYALLPILGPLGDRFSRKGIAIISDIWRGSLIVIISIMVFMDIFYLPLVIIIFILYGIGSALFLSIENSIVPQLVADKHLFHAMRHSQIITSLGAIIGSATGGLIVAFLGVGEAFILDASTFFIASLLAAFMKVKTTSSASKKPVLKSFKISSFAEEIIDGLRVLFKLPTLFGLSLVAMFINFSISPLVIVLPVLIKSDLNHDSWVYGLTQAGQGIGAILGGLFIGYLCRKIKADGVLILGTLLISSSFILFSLISNSYILPFLLLIFGIGCSITNIPIKTQMALSIPDHYRSRIFSSLQFFTRGIKPIGIALAGLIIESYNTKVTLQMMGTGVLLLVPGLLLIPHIKTFLRADPKETSVFFEKYYPGVIKKKQ